MNFTVNSTLKGQYRLYVLNEDNTPFEAGFTQGVWHDNLLTDGFMDAYAFLPVTSDFFGPRASFAVGTGVGIVRRDSGAITASQAGATVTASAGFFVAADVGQDLVWDTGQRSKVITFNSPTSVTVEASQTVASGQFEVEYVGRNSLVAQSERAFSDNGGFSGIQTFNIVGNELVCDLTITRILTLSANSNLTEWGLFDTTSAFGGNLTVYELFRDAGGNPITVTIPGGKKVRLDHRIVVRHPVQAQVQKFVLEKLDAANISQPAITAVTNASPISITAANHGFTTGDEVRVLGVLGNTAANGDWLVTVVDANTFTLNSSAGNGVYTAGSGKVSRLYTATASMYYGSNPQGLAGAFEPPNPPSISNSTLRTSLGGSTLPSVRPSDNGWASLSNSVVTSGLSLYVPGSFTRNKFLTWNESSFAGTFFAWSWDFASASSGWKCVLDPNGLTKTNQETFTMQTTFTWRRGA